MTRCIGSLAFEALPLLDLAAYAVDPTDTHSPARSRFHLHHRHLAPPKPRHALPNRAKKSNSPESLTGILHRHFWKWEADRRQFDTGRDDTPAGT